MNTQEFTLFYPWDNNGYKPNVDFKLTKLEDAFHLNIVAWESNPKRDETEQLHYVHRDSCVEWFAIFEPDKNKSYFNFELNANGVLYAAFGENRNERTLLDLEDVASLNIQSKISEDCWSIDFSVPFTFIQKYIPEFEWKEGSKIRANFYKCGDRTEYPHYGIWHPIDLPKPDFHCPEFFGEITF